MISPKSLMFFVIIIILIVSSIFFVRSAVVIWNASYQRLTGDIKLTQAAAFENSSNLYGVVMEANSVIRPGDTFTFTIRGLKSPTENTAAKVTFHIETTDTLFVKSIAPTKHSLDVAQLSSGALPIFESSVVTNKIGAPPGKLYLQVTQEVDTGEENAQSAVAFLTIEVDTAPFPIHEVVKAIISLAGFLLGIFGSKLF